MGAVAGAAWRFGGEASADQMDPDQMIPTDRKAWYESETRRRALQVADRELIKAEEVEVAIATAFSAIAQGLRSLPDNIERRTGREPAVGPAIEHVNPMRKWMPWPTS